MLCDLQGRLEIEIGTNTIYRVFHNLWLLLQEVIS